MDPQLIAMLEKRRALIEATSEASASTSSTLAVPQGSPSGQQSSTATAEKVLKESSKVKDNKPGPNGSYSAVTSLSRRRRFWRRTMKFICCTTKVSDE